LGRVASTRYYVIGLTCGGGGAPTLERVLLAVAGVRDAYVNPATRIAYLRVDTASCDSSSVVDAASQAGFGLVPLPLVS